jgi:hypothetical protein
MDIFDGFDPDTLEIITRPATPAEVARITAAINS